LIASPTVKSQSQPVLKSPVSSLNRTALADNHTRANHPKTNKNLPVKQSPLPVKAVEAGDQAELAATPRAQPEVIDAVAPDISTQIAIRQPLVETMAFKTKPPVPTVEMPAADKQGDLAAKPGKKLRSLGDIINIAVAKVDKRKDKFIEFSDTDDNGSTITAVNLGIIKIKKRE
jgi:hypothetical protein